MIFTQRKFSGAADLRDMAALAQAFPADNLHTVDLPYRFSSWAVDAADYIGLWFDAHGQLRAWAVMQTPFWTIDYACHPDDERILHRQILAWADRRAREALHTPSGRSSWFVMVFAGQAERIGDLEAASFASQAEVGENSWSKVLMLRSANEERSANTPEASHAPPAGFSIRPLRGDSEIEAYVELHRAVFESRNMTVPWRARTLHQPAYIPDLDLVAVAPDGRLAAFCIAWLHKNAGGEASGQIEPLGVHADFRKLGLGQAILTEGLRRLQLHGASHIYVETDNYRNAALELYEAVDFQVVQDVLVYRKDYGGKMEG